MNAEKEGLKRAMRYFVRQAQIYVICIIAGSFIFALYNQMVRGSVVSFQQFMRMLPWMQVSMTLIILMAVDASDGQLWYSMLISFGCRRKNLFLGILYMNLLIIGESMLLFWAGSKIFIKETLLWAIPVVAALNLVTAGIAQFTGIAIIKWGKTIYVVVIFGIVAGAVIIGMAASLISGGRNILEIAAAEMSQPKQQWTAILAAVVFYLLANGISYRLISNYEVKA